MWFSVPRPPWEDPKSRSPNSGLWYSYGVEYRTLTLRWIYFLGSAQGLGRCLVFGYLEP